MSKRFVKIAAVFAALAIVLAGFSDGADAAKKKKKKHYRQDTYSQGDYPNTISGHNQCMHDQTRYPVLDIRCR